jgi:hypothetical protein
MEAQALVVTSTILAAKVATVLAFPMAEVEVVQALLEMAQVLPPTHLTHQMAVLVQDTVLQPSATPLLVVL